jgi:hypothetical protein
MASSEEAKEALYTAIVHTASMSSRHNGTIQSAMLRDAAIAYRAVLGGPQPGSVTVESK